MQFDYTRWSLGGPNLLPEGCMVVMGRKMNGFVSLEKRCFWPSGAKRGVWGILSTILGRI